jgi:hypothetical protein
MIDAANLIETSTKYKKATGKAGSIANLEDIIERTKSSASQHRASASEGLNAI